ncbi:potassium/proton antiporter [Holdemania massiliensis]|nr:potassium/proton antiporter [Holdemania massiliensis]
MICILCNKLSFRLGVPSLLLFILLGMVFGSDGLFRIPFENYAFAEKLCTAALIYIMFYGGFGTRWKQARPVAKGALLLSSLGVFLTAALTGVFCHWGLGMEWQESFLIGAVISSTDAASMFSILRSKKLALKENTDSLLELESGSNDPFSYMLTVMLLTMMAGQGSPETFAWMLAKQLMIGGLSGWLCAKVGIACLNRFDFATEGFDSIFVVGLVLLTYALCSYGGGNGYLCVYLAGILMGNASLRNKRSLVHFFDGVTGLMQIVIFFLLGLLAFPSQLSSVILPALLIMAFLTLIARPVTVSLLLKPFAGSWRQTVLVSAAGLRGASSIVFAIMVTVSPAYTRYDVFHVVFCLVLLSISLQGTLLPWIARKLEMIDTGADVLKTFNDYKDDPAIEMIQLDIRSGHAWIGQSVQSLKLPGDVLLAMIRRQNENLVPHGQTIIKQGDVVIAIAPAVTEPAQLELTEMLIEEGHSWQGRRIKDLKLPPALLIMMILRDETLMVPDGNTQIAAEDVLIIHQPSNTKKRIK